MPKVSVIVAIYNVEAFLKRFLLSVANQTLYDIEVILVDDGSEDKSKEICCNFCVNDSRFKYFYKKNGGVSSAREFGVQHANGDYLIHADPDDWVDADMLEVLYTTAIKHNVDVVICDFYEHKGDISSLCQQKIDNLDASSIIRSYLIGSLHGSCCNKLVKREVWNLYDIHFPPTNLCEDLWVNVKLALNDVKFFYLNKAYYHYIKGENVTSITAGMNPKAGYNSLSACICFTDLLKHTPYWKLFVETNMAWMAYLVLYYGAATSNQYKQLFEPLSSLHNINKMLSLSLANYRLARLLIETRKLLSRSFRRLKRPSSILQYT